MRDPLERISRKLGKCGHWKKEACLDSLMFERKVVVRFDDDSISATYPTGEVESVEWQAIMRAVIETNDSGPWGADFWWILEGEVTRCTFPQGAAGELDAMEVFPIRFPGFDQDALDTANRSTSNERFVCWERCHAE